MIAKKNHRFAHFLDFFGTRPVGSALGEEIKVKGYSMRSILYLIGLIVVVLAILRFAFDVI